MFVLVCERRREVRGDLQCLCVCMYVRVCVCVGAPVTVGVRVVTVDIMLTSSQSSLLVSLELWGTGVKPFTHSCLL